MEYIHGETGNAILIRRELIADLPVHNEHELRIHFEHFFWHKLGYFYAINAETDWKLYRSRVGDWQEAFNDMNK